MFVKVNNRPATNNFSGLLGTLFNELDPVLNNVFTREWNNGFAPLNIAETAEAYHLEIAAPGRKKENFKVKFEVPTLTISYDETQTETTPNTDLKQVRKEFTTAQFKRSFNIDEKVNADGILAKYEDGLLKIYLPKKAEAKPLAKDITIG